MPENTIADIAKQYHERGFAGPLKMFDEADLEGVAAAFMEERKSKGGGLLATRNRHLDWDIVRRLALSGGIAEAVKSILGDELVLWRSQFFAAQAGQGLGWHQDEYTKLLSDSVNQLSVHLAITEATLDNCVMIVPGSHKMSRGELKESGFNFIVDSAYGTSTYWRAPKDSVEVMKMTLRPGQCFIFHPFILHASYDQQRYPDDPASRPKVPAAPGAMPRIGLGLRFTVPQTEVYAAAFAETAARGDHCVRI